VFRRLYEHVEYKAEEPVSKPCRLIRVTRRSVARRVDLPMTTIGRESRSSVSSAGTRTTPTTTPRRTAACSISVVPRNRRFLVCKRDARRLEPLDRDNLPDGRAWVTPRKHVRAGTAHFYREVAGI